MNNNEISKKEYYLNSSILFFKTHYEKRLKFLKRKIYLFNEIANFINNCIDSTKDTFIFCAGNSLLAKNIKSKKYLSKKLMKNTKLIIMIILSMNMKTLTI